jgi:hypothetical protein
MGFEARSGRFLICCGCCPGGKAERTHVIGTAVINTLMRTGKIERFKLAETKTVLTRGIIWR